MFIKLKGIPNLETYTTQNNKLKEFKYYSFEERLFDLSELFKSNINQKNSQILQANTYEGVARHYKSNEPRKNHLIYNGIYKLAPIKDYVGIIPEVNQIEIREKFKSLIDNPFLNQEFELLILAPINNFAESESVKAIDPIAFAYYKEGKNFGERNYLITLSQWL